MMTVRIYKKNAASGQSRPPGHGGANTAQGTPKFLRVHPATAKADVAVMAPEDAREREADAIAGRFEMAPERAAKARHSAAAASTPAPLASTLARQVDSNGRPLDAATRSGMEARFSTDLGQVRVHTGTLAEGLNRDLGSRAFTQGPDIFYGPGQQPGDNELTAHELTHVVQQSGGASHTPLGPISAGPGGAPIQCSFTGSYVIPGRDDGGFEIDLQTREGALATPTTASGMDGYIRYVPAPGAPNSNVIAMTQIVKLTDQGGSDLNPASMPAAQAPRGALGTPGLRTEDDAKTGVEGGFFTDVHHRPNAGSPGAPQGSFLSPRYNFQPAAPGTTGVVGQTQQPALYGGGIGGVVGQTPGFKRSDDPADIRSAVMYDTPGTTSATANLDFKFETAALGEDTGITYGAVQWGFGVHAGHVVNEYINVGSAQSATFGEALERHRDFYVHEPVTFYFGFDDARLSAAEAAKIDAFLPYLARNTDVQLSLEGYADMVGGPGAYNADLSMRRVEAVEVALLAKGIAASRLASISIGHGASTSATTDAGTGDQGGNTAVGADQSREANRWANRRVVLSFSHPAPAAPAPGP